MLEGYLQSVVDHKFPGTKTKIWTTGIANIPGVYVNFIIDNSDATDKQQYHTMMELTGWVETKIPRISKHWTVQLWRWLCIKINSTVPDEHIIRITDTEGWKIHEWIENNDLTHHDYHIRSIFGPDLSIWFKELEIADKFKAAFPETSSK